MKNCYNIGVMVYVLCKQKCHTHWTNKDSCTIRCFLISDVSPLNKLYIIWVMFLAMLVAAISVVQSVNPPLWSRLKYPQQVFDGFPWNFVQTFVVPTWYILMTLVIPWLFLLQVSSMIKTLYYNCLQIWCSKNVLDTNLCAWFPSGSGLFQPRPCSRCWGLSSRFWRWTSQQHDWWLFQSNLSPEEHTTSPLRSCQ